MDTIQPTIPAQSSASSWRWWVLAIVGIAELMIVLDATIVNIALPSAQHALGFANSDREWIVTAYALAFGSFLLPGGRLGDIFGRKWTFIGVPRQATRWSLLCRKLQVPRGGSPVDSRDTARLIDEGYRLATGWLAATRSWAGLSREGGRSWPGCPARRCVFPGPG